MDRVVRPLLVVLLGRAHQAVQLHQVVRIHPFDPLLQFDLVDRFHLLDHDNHVDRPYPVNLAGLGIHVVLVDPGVPESINNNGASRPFLLTASPGGPRFGFRESRFRSL